MRLLKVAFFVASLFLFVKLAYSNPWCDKKYNCFNQMKGSTFKHTMCQYKEKGPPMCHHWQHGLTDEEKAYVLHWHNEVRAKVARGEMQGQPRATNMLRMEWDDETEMIAQRWASQCEDQTGHDDCRHLWSKVDAGQNYAWKAGSSSYGSPPPRIQILGDMFHNQWIYNEVNGVAPQYIANYPSGCSSGHYTQAVWAESTRLGCGLAYLQENQGGMLSWEYRLICNYVVRGNFYGKPIYLTGNEPATECPENSKPSVTYHGLCEYPQKYYDFGKLLADRSNENSKTPNLVQKPGHPSQKPSLQKQPSTTDTKNNEQSSATPPNQKQTSRTSTNPAASKTQNNSQFRFNFGNIPVFGRFFKNDPVETSTAQKNQAKPISASKPLEFGLVRRTGSQQEQKTYRTDDDKTKDTDKSKYGLRNPITDTTQRVYPPKFTTRPTLDDGLGERSEVPAPNLKIDIRTYTPRPTLDDNLFERTRFPTPILTPPGEPMGRIDDTSYFRNPKEYKSPGNELRQTTISSSQNPFEQIRRQHEDLQRIVQASHRRFQQETGMPSSIFEPHTDDFLAPPPVFAVSPYSRSRVFATTSRFDGGFQTDDGLVQRSFRRNGIFQK